MTPAKPILVGGFVLGALALGVVAILAFGGLELSAHELRVVAVFRHSVAGLDAGAPVTFRGVQIGHVEGMRVHVDVQRQLSWIPVYLDIDLGRISWTNGVVGGQSADLEAAVNSGLRAQLVSQGLVSGQLSVNLDYYPETRPLRSGRAGDAFEIPTIPSDLQNLKDELHDLHLPEISQKTQQVLGSLQHVLQKIDGKIDPVTDSLEETLTKTSEAVSSLQTNSARTLTAIDRLADESRRQVQINGQDLDELLKTAGQTTREADALVASLNDMSSPRGDLQASLRDLAASASALRSVTHDFERNPLGTLLRKDKE